MKLNSNLNFTKPLMFYLQTEVVFKAAFFNWRLPPWDTISRAVFNSLELSWENIHEIDKLS